MQFVITTTEPIQNLYEVANQVKEKAEASGLFFFIDSDLKLDKPQATLDINRDMVADMCLTQQDVGSSLGAALGGGYVNYFSIAGRSYKVIPQVLQKNRLNPDQVLDYYVRSGDGSLMPARTVAKIEPEWVEAVGAHLVKKQQYDPHWEKARSQVVAFERATLYGLPLYSQRRIHYGPMAPTQAREIFIRRALVDGEFDTRAPFFVHNRKLTHDIEQLEHKSRRPDVLVDDELIHAFYDSLVPPGIHKLRLSREQMAVT